MIDRLIAHSALFGVLLCSTHLVAVERHQIVHNFTAQLPSSETITCGLAEEVHSGLGTAALRYAFEDPRKPAALDFAEQAYPISGAGTLRMWVKGDGSGNKLRLVLRHGKIRVETNGESRMINHKDVRPDQVTLDFTGWREISFEVKDIPDGKLLWWRRLEIHPGGGDERPQRGTILLDDLRLLPQTPASEGALAVNLVGPAIRNLGDEIAIGVDARNFSAKSGTMRVRLTMVDRNQNLVADRDFSVPIAASTAEETRLDLAPEQLASFLPPFRITGDVICPELPHLTQRIDETLVLGNGLMLFAEMGDALGQWFTAGHSIPESSRNGLKEWLMAGGQRTSPITQTAARITREAVSEEEAAALAGDQATQPLGRYALGISYTGAAVVYRGADRYIPGNAFALGMWVKGDGSGSQLVACVLDYSDLSDFWHGGWKRQYEERLLCTLDFTGWRYVEVDLPGKGLGTNLVKGSTPDIDFPIELTALKVVPTTAETSGTLQVGAIYAKTQVATAETLAVHLGYDDAEQRYGDDRGAWLVAHNGAPTTPRSVAGRWEVLDRSEKRVASGTFEAELAPGESTWQRLEFGAEVAAATGPLTIRASVSDARDATVTATRALVVSKPDSIILHTDFESERGYLGLKADGIPEPPQGVPVTATSTERAHGGERSLAIGWAKDGQAASYVAIDPELTGVPTEISMWVHGDGSGALFHPVIGDRSGIAHGVALRGFDLVLPRVDGPLQNAVRLDWQGWRELSFRLPPVPQDWDVELPILPYAASYPLGLHLAVDGASASAASGTVYVDDIRVTTHLAPEARVTMSTMRDGLPNIVPPGTVLQVRVANADRLERRSVRLTGGAYDVGGRVVAAVPADEIGLNPGENRMIELSPPIPAGAYAVRIELMADGRSIATSEEDLIVGDPVPFLGETWRQAMADEFALRKPLKDPVIVVDEDWDWVEFYPGNFQLDTLRERSSAIAETGMSPWMLLGYSAFWSAGIGLQQLESGSFERARRGPGHGVDIFLVPERDVHWRDYVAEVMRGIGQQVGGFVLWDNPDGTSSLAVPPEKLAQFLAETDRWRRIYCPETPLIIGGMAQATALPYLSELAKYGALEHMGGVNVRFDLGRLSPEDAQIEDFARSVLRIIDPEGERQPLLHFTDLDWAVERSHDGMDAFMQAAYLVRSDLTMRPFGVSPALTVRNGDSARIGPGLAYRPVVHAPPIKEQRAEFLVKPGWWAMARIRHLFAGSTVIAESEVADVVPARTRCLLMRREADDTGVLLIWRNDDPGLVSLGGLEVAAAEDCFGGTVTAVDGWWRVGPAPLVLSLDEPAEQVAARLTSLRVRDGEEASWPQRPVAVIEPVAGGANGFRHSGAERVTLSGITADGRERSWPGLRYADGGEESFRVEFPAGCGLVLRHRYQLEHGGFTARVAVDGASIGDWNLQHAEPELSDGLREAVYVIPAEALAGKTSAEISLTYAGTATSGSWSVFAYEGGPFPLSSLGPVHADQAVGRPRLARSLIGEALKIGTQVFDNGVAVHANSLLEYPLNGQFSRFRAQVGVDAAADGRGSVVFEVWADGEKRWASPVMSGLDEARTVDVEVNGVDRLRLVLRDGGDGNRLDAGNWCDAELDR